MKLHLPCISISPVYHVGTLDPADKGNRATSYEGKGLSVSTEPDAWVSIAQLGGHPTHKLTKKDPKFLDFHAMLEEKSNKQALYQWAKGKGYLTTGEVWSISYYDDEWERKMRFYTDREEEAKEERADGRTVRKLKNFPIPTDAALTQSGIHPSSKLTSVHDVLALLLAEEQGIDGVWWADDLDESRLSAPRGVIFPAMLTTWHCK